VDLKYTEGYVMNAKTIDWGRLY